MLFKSTEPQVENDYSSNFDFHIGKHGIFLSALIEKRKKIGYNLVTTYKIFVVFSLCSPQKKLKTKDHEEQIQKRKNNIRVAPCQKTGTIYKR